MPISIIPKFLQKAFAQDGGRQDVPISGDTSLGRATYETGFAAINRIPIEAGGIPPFGTDMNGVLYDVSAAIQYLQSGHEFPFDAVFAASIGGYGVGAVVSDSSDKSLLWVNGTNANSAFPSGWSSFRRSDPTESVRGFPLVATQAETNAGTNNAKIVTPSKLRAGFSINISTSGSHITFPTWMGGLVIQFGNATTETTTPFPIAFPSALRAIVGAHNGSSYGGISFLGSATGSTTFQGIKSATSGNPIGFFWIAIGN